MPSNMKWLHRVLRHKLTTMPGGAPLNSQLWRNLHLEANVAPERIGSKPVNHRRKPRPAPRWLPTPGARGWCDKSLVGPCRRQEGSSIFHVDSTGIRMVSVGAVWPILLYSTCTGLYSAHHTHEPEATTCFRDISQHNTASERECSPSQISRLIAL